MLSDEQMLDIALEEARLSMAEGGVPVGAAFFDPTGNLVSRGHNRLVQAADPSAHGEIDAFRRIGRRATFRDLTLVTSLQPCWYCSGLVRQFQFRRVVIGEETNFSMGTVQWLRGLGFEVRNLESPVAVEMLARWMAENPELIGEDAGR
jgi:cytosine/creatinine deaminase